MSNRYAQTRPRLTALLRDYGSPLLFYILLAMALSWPTARDFTTAIASDGGPDVRLNIWSLWHAQQALLGHEPLLYAHNLYYPVGVSLLTHSPGPLMGLFALPFWPLGLSATYNAVLIIGLALTGFCMYLLGRGLGFRLSVALFSGTVLMTAPMVMGGLLQHMDKTFLGLIPLTLLTTLYALDAKRSGWWALAPGVVLLLTTLHGGWHFVVSCIGIAVLVAATWLRRVEVRRVVVQRAALAAVFVVLLVGPTISATASASETPGISLDRTLQSLIFHPDLAQLVLPSPYSRLHAPDLAALEAKGLKLNVETAINLAWTGLALAALGLVALRRRAWPWGLLFLVGVALALGPTLRVMGKADFTEFKVPVVLPYAFLTELPGLSFMRTPGRFMFLGFTAFAALAGFGLTWLTARFPRLALPIVGAAFALLLVEVWPAPWPQDTYRPAPAFYQQIASDPEMYGVFDVPYRQYEGDPGIFQSSFAQVWQITHGKGIPVGYVSYTYDTHPVFRCLYGPETELPDLRVDWRRVNCYSNAAYVLAQNNYRYVVWHKPSWDNRDYRPFSQTDMMGHAFIREALDGYTPIADDDLATVYALPRRDEFDLSTLKTTIEYRDGWEERAGPERWAMTPASLYAISPTTQSATLRLTLSALFDPDAPNVLGQTGRLTVTVGNESQTVDVTVDETVDIPITLQPGGQDITLFLEAGNFRLTNEGERVAKIRSFAVRRIDLFTQRP